jgi:hypothetical protein
MGGWVSSFHGGVGGRAGARAGPRAGPDGAGQRTKLRIVFIVIHLLAGALE